MTVQGCIQDFCLDGTLGREAAGRQQRGAPPTFLRQDHTWQGHEGTPKTPCQLLPHGEAGRESAESPRCLSESEPGLEMFSRWERAVGSLWHALLPFHTLERRQKHSKDSLPLW